MYGVYRVEGRRSVGRPRTSLECCCLPSETYGRNGVFQFSDLFTELPVPPLAAGVVGPVNVLLIYHSEHYAVSFWDVTDVILFLQD